MIWNLHFFTSDIPLVKSNLFHEIVEEYELDIVLFVDAIVKHRLASSLTLRNVSFSFKCQVQFSLLSFNFCQLNQMSLIAYIDRKVMHVVYLLNGLIEIS